MIHVAIVDGQGGGVGKALVESLRRGLGSEVRITALGTNSAATSAMLKAGADEGATGENAITVNVARADIVMGAVGVLSADSMLGEITAAMTVAIGRSAARKVLIPLNRCNLEVAGVKDMPFSAYIDEAVAMVKASLGG
ncbi:MAG: DUF3842 family protein [Planctomycetaceae bacterium]|nr:DUF3842 family protein [Planctomycetaceae bacterium]